MLDFISKHSCKCINDCCSQQKISVSFKLLSYVRAYVCVCVCVCLFVLRFYGPVNPMGSCRARSVYLTTRLLGRLSPLSG